MIFILLFAGFAGSVLSATQIPNPDDAWLLIATGRFMDGAIIGRDLFELNPPLIYWLMAPSVWLSRWLRSDYYTTYCLWVGLIASLSCYLSFKAMTQAGIGVIRARVAALAGLALFFTISSSDYGQRDPLAYQLASPFLLTEALRARGQPVPRYPAARIAALAAIGFLLKPYMALVPVALFAWRVIRERTVTSIISSDSIIMLAMALAYIAYVVFYAPAYLNVACLALIAYPAYDSTCLKLLISFVPPTLTSLILWLVMVRMPQGTTAAGIKTLLLTTVAFILGALTQLKGWGLSPRS